MKSGIPGMAGSPAAWIPIFGLLLLLLHSRASAQFSPGELSAAHAQLEGPSNCTRCHEVGKTISGQKCLSCHTEIERAVTNKHGFHFRVRSRACVECHKEHLGRTAPTYRFSPQSFNHAETGFVLQGKHAPLRCIQCHTVKSIADPEVAKLVTDHPHSSYLGLRPDCYSCHSNPHEATLGQKCASCHSAEGWKTVAGFDHSRTRFPLRGKHQSVECRQCHTSFAKGTSGGEKNFQVAEFSSCESCHKTPHTGRKFQEQSCTACHTEQGWTVPVKKSFDHSMTGFPLTGKHAVITCGKCHKEARGETFAQKYRLPHKKCIDCHEDYHNGDFARTYANDCARCHTTAAFAPSTYTVSAHNATRFRLWGSHLALRCEACHKNPATQKAQFRFRRTECDVCHQNVHDEPFTGNGKSLSCATCHTVEQWKTVKYDHSRTSFTLTGKHLSTACGDCHKRRSNGRGVQVPFKGLKPLCQSCHADIHNGQFEKDGAVACERCHSAERWRALLFDHQRQSSFALTGAHLKVPCAQCHKPETAGTLRFVRYKPLARDCESCHQGKRPQ